MLSGRMILAWSCGNCFHTEFPFTLHGHIFKRSLASGALASVEGGVRSVGCLSAKPSYCAGFIMD